MSGASLGRIEIEIDGDGPPIVFLHGLGATSSSFQPLLSALHGFRCIRPDFPGAGRSARSYVPVTIDFLCETARDIVKGIAGAPAHIVAHSMGTLVAQHLAVAASEWVASLTLFGPIGEPGEAARERLRDRAALARRSGMIAIADPVAAAGLASSTKARQSGRRSVRTREPSSPGPGGFRTILRGFGVGEGRRPPAHKLPDPHRDRRRRSYRPSGSGAGACGEDQGR